MTMLLAKGGQASPTEQLICFIFLAVVVIIALITNGLKTYNVNVKGGLPYCKNCGRQVSYRRDYCRACGVKFVSYGMPSSQESDHDQEGYEQLIELGVQSRLKAEAEERRRDKESRRQQRKEKKEQRRESRNEWYSARGIEPGPFAWFKVLPEIVRLIILGVLFALPFVVVLCFLLSRT